MRSIVMLVALLAGTDVAAAASDPFRHELREIRDGVYVAVRPDVNRVPVEGNITFIVNRDDVVVVDSGGTPAAAMDAIALLKTKTDKPVSAIINTHWHGDHHLGNSVWKREWPDAEIIAHANTYKAMTGEPMAYLETLSDEPLLNRRKAMETFIQSGRDEDGRELSAAEIDRYRDIVAVIPLLIEQNRQLKMVVPTRTFSDVLRLDRPGRRIDIRYLGRGNTDGDSVVHLPDDGVVITGDLVVMPLPYGFYSYPSDWIDTLKGIKALQWTTLVPGHGEPQANADYLDLLIALLASVREHVAAGIADGHTLEQIRASLDLGDTRRRITGGDPVRERLFEAYWIMPITKSAWKEASGIEIVQGVEPI